MRVYREITSGTGVAARTRAKEREQNTHSLAYFPGGGGGGGTTVVPGLARAPIKSR